MRIHTALARTVPEMTKTSYRVCVMSCSKKNDNWSMSSGWNDYLSSVRSIYGFVCIMRNYGTYVIVWRPLKSLGKIRKRTGRLRIVSASWLSSRNLVKQRILHEMTSEMDNFRAEGGTEILARKFSIHLLLDDVLQP